MCSWACWLHAISPRLVGCLARRFSADWRSDLERSLALHLLLAPQVFSRAHNDADDSVIPRPMVKHDLDRRTFVVLQRRGVDSIQGFFSPLIWKCPDPALPGMYPHVGSQTRTVHACFGTRSSMARQAISRHLIKVMHRPPTSYNGIPGTPIDNIKGGHTK
jgi:hypothetical protein